MNKIVQRYHVIFTHAIGIKRSHLNIPGTSLRFKFTEDKNEYKHKDIRKQGKKATKGSKITNFSILKRQTAGTKKNFFMLNDHVKIDGLKNYNNYDKLNVDITIRDSKLSSFLLTYNRLYKYRVVINNLLFSFCVTKDINIIFVSCNGLNDPKDALINRKLYKELLIYIR